MPRILPVGAILLVDLVASFGLSGQTPDPRLDDAVKEIALLKRMAADQDRRIGHERDPGHPVRRMDAGAGQGFPIDGQSLGDLGGVG